MRLTLLTLLLAACALAQPRFEKDILPIFTANCFACHGGRQMVGLDLRTAASALRGSDQGKVIVKGDAAKSLLYEKVSSRAMPPPAFNLKLTDSQIETIKLWINAGAPSEEAEAAAARWKQQTANFEQTAQPVLKAKCVACHSGPKAQAGLDLSTFDAVLKGSASGPVIHEGVADKSVLIRRIASKTMPPPGAGKPVTDDELALLRKWVDTTRFPVREATAERTTFTKAEAPEITAKDRAYWAFVKPTKLAAPSVRARNRVRNPIDNFILAKLEAKGLSLSPDATDLTLLRRAYFDLTGLPPTPKQIEEFLADTKPGAYERLIDRLLESPHYGERWGRYWLDEAGYSDAAGFDNCFPVIELFDSMWRYRDYVVQAFNNDKPYDRFLQEQLAGDELVDWRHAAKYTPEIREALTATGYLRNVYDRTDADIVNLVEERYDVLFALMEKVSTGVMGLTVNCARCHTHKFDPIPQRDYYRMLAIFMPAYNPMSWKQPKNRWLADVAKSEEDSVTKHNAEIDRQIGDIKKQIEKLRKPYEDKLFEAKLQNIPQSVRTEARSAIAVPAEKRDPVQKFLVGKFETQLKVTSDEIEKALKEDERTYIAKLQGQIKTFEGYKRSTTRIQALWDTGAPPVSRLLQRGSVESPGPRVQAGILSVLNETGADFPKPDAKAESSNFRLSFAKWLTNRDHPLTARVFVNRVWQYHFGRGIVETSENFGKMGTPPTHPELLDYLAVDFMENGWRVKRLHKQIMLSTAYRQSSHQRDDGRKLDPDNHLLWRTNLRRLDAESIRDSVLSASGNLDPTLGGPPIKLKVRPDGLQELAPDDKAPATTNRRSLYIMSRRNYPHQFLQVFDFPTIQVNCLRRSTSATPLQSLALMNDEFVLEQSRHLATRALAAKDPIESAYLLTLSRKPDQEERRLADHHLLTQKQTYTDANAPATKAAQSAMASLCQMLLASNEFLYVD